MQDYVRRFIIAGIMALCVALLFLGVKNVEAKTFKPAHDENLEWIWPSEGVLTDIFGSRNGKHKGIDIAAEGGSPVYAVDKGQVTKSYYSDTYGHVVFVKHEYGIETVYAHLQERTVQKGDKVSRGDVLGKMGSTGDSSGVHLHFEVHEQEWTFDKKNAINPLLTLGNIAVGQAVTGGNPAFIEASARPRGKGTQPDEKGQAPEEYIVQAGDTLTAIARKNHMSVNELIALNGLKDSLIHPGQKIYINQ